MTTSQITLDSSAVMAKLEARFREQLRRNADEMSRLIVENAHLEAYAASLEQRLQQQSDQAPDPWGDDNEKGPQ